MLKTIRHYFAENLTPSVRYLHYSILLLVLLQIILSNFIKINNDGVIGLNAIEYYSTWAHISIGLLLVLLSIVFVVVELSKHGFSYFYPYLSGDLSQLKSDLSQLKSLKLPDASPKGLAATIQGLGLGAILLVVLSGTIWFVMWSYELAFANDVKEIHKSLTGLIEAYIIGHGGMGLMHIFIDFKKRKKFNK